MTGLELGGAAVADDVPLAPLTTLRIGPVARRLITCTSTEQIVEVLRASDDVLVLAGGSNVVLADDLADLNVVLLANTEITVEDNIVRAEAGAVWDDVVATSRPRARRSGMPLGDPGIRRRDARAERRRVRRRGRVTSAASGCSTGAPARTAG